MSLETCDLCALDYCPICTPGFDCNGCGVVSCADCNSSAFTCKHCEDEFCYSCEGAEGYCTECTDLTDED